MALRILGLDPGSRVTGYGVIEEIGRGKASLVSAGVVRTPDKEEFSLRLKIIFEGLREVIARHCPNEAAVEDVFAAKNVRSALKLGQARGVALLAAAQSGLPVFEYPPAVVKMSLVGAGRADKEQVRAMVARLLRCPRDLPLDASDALAAALAHLHTRKLGSRGMR